MLTPVSVATDELPKPDSNDSSKRRDRETPVPDEKLDGYQSAGSSVSQVKINNNYRALLLK